MNKNTNRRYLISNSEHSQYAAITERENAWRILWLNCTLLRSAQDQIREQSASDVAVRDPQVIWCQAQEEVYDCFDHLGSALTVSHEWTQTNSYLPLYKLQSWGQQLVSASRRVLDFVTLAIKHNEFLALWFKEKDAHGSFSHFLFPIALSRYLPKFWNLNFCNIGIKVVAMNGILNQPHMNIHALLNKMKWHYMHSSSDSIQCSAGAQVSILRPSTLLNTIFLCS